MNSRYLYRLNARIAKIQSDKLKNNSFSLAIRSKLMTRGNLNQSYWGKCKQKRSSSRKKLLKESRSNSSSKSIKKYSKKLLSAVRPAARPVRSSTMLLLLPTMEKSLNNGTTKSLLFGSKRFKKLTTN